MRLLDKYKKKIRREILKKDAVNLSRIISKYGLNLFLKDRDSFLFDLEATDNLRHLLVEKSYLDGGLSKILNKLSHQKYELCIDIGANFGLSSMLLGKNSYQVIAFEPESSNCERFKKLIELNRANNIELIEKAVSAHNGKASFFIANKTSHHSLGTAHSGQSNQNTVEVDTVTLDSFCRERKIQKIDILKVDVEGFELDVFEGGSALFKEKKIEHLIFEVSLGVMERLGRNPIDIINFLEGNDYKIEDQYGNNITSAKVNAINGQDLLATPRRQRESRRG